MIRINLLPHREIKRKQQQKEFFIMLGAVLGLGAAAWFAVHSYLGGQLEEQNGRNTYLESEIAVLEKQIDEIKKLKEQTAALLQRKKVVESLQANRAETVYLLDQLVRQLPDGVYLRTVNQKGNKVTIGGFAQSNARVSTFMRNLESSPYLEKPVLIQIASVADKTSRLSDFSLSVLLTRNKEEQAQTPAKKPAAKPTADASGVLPTAQVIAQTAPAPTTRSAAASTRTGTPAATVNSGSPMPSLATSATTDQRR
jgi:type IV pilus assembly protein PilN